MENINAKPRRSRYDNDSNANHSSKLVPFSSKVFEEGELKTEVIKSPEVGLNDQIVLPLIK